MSEFTEPMVYVAPSFQQVGINTLLANSAAAGNIVTPDVLAEAVAGLQAQIDELTARVAALENPPA